MTVKQIEKFLKAFSDQGIWEKQFQRQFRMVIPELSRCLSDFISDTPSQEQKVHERAREVLDYLNGECNRAFRPTESNLKLISSRLSEGGVEVEGVMKMIRRMVAKWRGTEMEEYLRPLTLFRASNFDNYYANRDMPVHAGLEQHVRRGENI